MSMGEISKHNTRTNITFPETLKFELEELAKQDNRSLNNLVILMLEDYLPIYKKFIQGKHKFIHEYIKIKDLPKE